jgi:site-specific recombinase XerC
VGYQERRGAAMIAVFRATGIRLSELAGILYDTDDPQRSDLDLWHREITVCGKGRREYGKRAFMYLATIDIAPSRSGSATSPSNSDPRGTA